MAEMGYRSIMKNKIPAETFPVFLLISGKQVCIIGGGKVAYRKALLALEAGADLKVIAPQLNNKFNRISPWIDIIQRDFRSRDISGASLVYAATDDHCLNRSIITLCRERGILSCSVDENWQYGDFITPSVHARKGVKIAVSSGGQNYRKSRFIGKELSKHVAALNRRGLIILGISYKEVGPDKLDELKREIVDIQGYLLQLRGVYEFMLLDTCNRIELFAVADTENQFLPGLIKKILHFDKLGTDSCYVYRGRKAFIYSCKVVSGLYSRIRGEYHIVSQFKEAVNDAIERKECGNILKNWTDSVLNISKKIRREFSGIIKVKEIEDQSIDFARNILNDIGRSTIMVAGTGILGKNIVTGLSGKIRKLIWVYHKNKPDISYYMDIEVCSISEMKNYFCRADMIITAFTTTGYIINRNSGKYFPDGKETLILDLGIPRNVNDDIESNNIRVVNMNDLNTAEYSEQPEIESRIHGLADSVIGENWSLYEKLKNNLKCRYTFE